MSRLPIFSIIFATVLFICISTSCTSFFLFNKPLRTASGFASDVTSTASHENQKHTANAATEKRIMQSLVSFGLALTTFTTTSQALDLPASYTSDDKSITFKYSDDLVFSPKPLKTHDKEILFKSETIKGFNAGVSVS
jgi:hypothetical protein